MASVEMLSGRVVRDLEEWHAGMHTIGSYTKICMG